jgi:colicin import membrane protein
MHSMYAADADERLAFAPPAQPGLVRAFGLAVFAHLLLVLALMHGLQWKRETQIAAVEAELWSAQPQQAAPREVVPPPPPPPPPAPVVKAPPVPEPPAVKAPEPPPPREADIAIAREQQKRALEKKRLAEEREIEKKLEKKRLAEEREADRKKLALEREAEKKKLALQEREQRRKLEAQKKRDDELERREQAKLAATDARRKEEDKRRRQEQDAKKLAQMREDNLKRIQGLAGSTGGPNATGTAAQSSGPSANWGGKVQAIVMPKITFVRETSASWVTEVEVRLSSSGAILSRHVVKRSASREWDDAVLAALDKTERLPGDTDGRVPTAPVTIVFRPQR